MRHFEAAAEFVLRNEGGWSDHPADPGGKTHRGVILQVLMDLGEWADRDGDGDVDYQDLRLLSREDAKHILLEHPWQGWRRLGLSDVEDGYVATKVFDIVWVSGPKQGGLVAQRALKAAGRPVKIDGWIGAKTRAALSAVDPIAFVPGHRGEAAGFFRMLGAMKPELGIEFLAGWLNRAYR